MDKPLSRIVQCYICEREELAVQALLPDGWIITWDTTTTLCSSCLRRWVEKFNEEPIHWLKGGEDELSIPEDSAHRR